MYEYFELINLVMVYLLGVVFVATRFGRGPSVLASFLSVLAFNFFFVPPRFSFAVSDVEYIFTFVVMLAVGLITSNLTVSLRSQAKVAGHRERRAAVLYAFTRELSAARRIDDAARNGGAAHRRGIRRPERDVAARQCRQDRLSARRRHPVFLPRRRPRGRAMGIRPRQNRPAPVPTRLPGAEAVYFPMPGASGPVGVLAILPINLRRVFLPEQQRLLDTFITQIVQAIERVRLSEQAQAAKILAETESLRNALLNAISHDFRTPLASIIGAASSLMDEATRLTPEARGDLVKTIYDEGRRMTRLANNILDMARLESGVVKLTREWVPLEEIIGSVLTHLRARLGARPVEVSLPHDLPLV